MKPFSLLQISLPSTKWQTLELLFGLYPKKKHNATVHIEEIQLISCLNFRNSVVKMETV